MDGRQQGSTKLKVYGAVVFTTRSCTAASRGPPTDVTKSSSPLTPPIPQDTPQHTLEGQNQQSPTVKFCSNMSSIITFIRKVQIKWACHVTRVPDDRIPKQLLYGELCQGKRSVGGQRKRFTNSLRVSLIDFSIHTHTWEEQLRMFWLSSTPKDEQKTIFI